MSLYKQAKDIIIRGFLGKDAIPPGLFELSRYFGLNRTINFHYEKQEDGSIVAVSTDFKQGSIVTSGKDPKDLDEKIKDAILTAFEVPSSYAKDVGVHREGETAYASA